MYEPWSRLLKDMVFLRSLFAVCPPQIRETVHHEVDYDAHIVVVHITGVCVHAR